jgi:hypothetical protein
MQPSTPPNAAAVEVVATQPTEADTASIAQLSAEASKSLPPVAYLVKVRLEEMPPVTSEGWALYIGGAARSDENKLPLQSDVLK